MARRRGHCGCLECSVKGLVWLVVLVLWFSYSALQLFLLISSAVATSQRSSTCTGFCSAIYLATPSFTIVLLVVWLVIALRKMMRHKSRVFGVPYLLVTLFSIGWLVAIWVEVGPQLQILIDGAPAPAPGLFTPVTSPDSPNTPAQEASTFIRRVRFITILSWTLFTALCILGAILWSFLCCVNCTCFGVCCDCKAKKREDPLAPLRVPLFDVDN